MILFVFSRRSIKKPVLLKFQHFTPKVALGGGRRYFQPNTTEDPEYGTKNRRTDGKDLIAEWEQNQKNNGLDAKYVWRKEEFDNVDPVTTDRLLGEKKSLNLLRTLATI